jgi:hypothetical protein
MDCKDLKEADMTEMTEAQNHTMACWSAALFDTAENLGEVDALGTEVTPAYIREVAASYKAEGTSSCVCDLDDPFYEAHPDMRPMQFDIMTAARYYGFANDVIDAEATA